MLNSSSCLKIRSTWQNVTWTLCRLFWLSRGKWTEVNLLLFIIISPVLGPQKAWRWRYSVVRDSSMRPPSEDSIVNCLLLLKCQKYIVPRLSLLWLIIISQTHHHKGTNPAKKWALPKLLNADDDNDGCNDNYDGNFDDNYEKTSQELRMLSSVTLDCQVTKIMNSGSQL